MTPAQAAFEQVMKLREKATPVPLRSHVSGSDGVYILPDTGNLREDMKYIAKVDGRDLIADQANAELFVAAVNFLALLPAYVAEQREPGRTPQHTSPGGVAVPAHVMKHEYCPACMAATPAQGAPGTREALVATRARLWVRQAEELGDKTDHVHGLSEYRIDAAEQAFKAGWYAALAQPGAPTKEQP